MAHVKTASAARMNRDSKPKHLGVKLYSGAKALVGSILIRQKGTKFRAGLNVGMGNDYTLYSLKQGTVKFSQRLGKRFVSVFE